ncbi:MAG: hypothetical protein ACYCS7_11835 [Acidimicrobiales bacterium]
MRRTRRGRWSSPVRPGGSAGAARVRLEADGYAVIGGDRRDAEVIADLATPEGSVNMVEGVTQACGGTLDGLRPLLARGRASGSTPSRPAGFFCGPVVFMDGGTDAAVRGDEWPKLRP